MPAPEPPPLPEVHEGVVDARGVEMLLTDLERAAQILEIVPKLGPRERAPEGTIDLAAARRLLAEGVRGLQIRYRFEGAEWWDTLIRCPGRGNPAPTPPAEGSREGGWRLVRIRHDFGRPDSFAPAERAPAGPAP